MEAASHTHAHHEMPASGRALTQVASGLREGDQVVVGNVGTLGRGMKVTIIGSDAQQGGGRGGAAPGAAPGGGSGR